MRPDVARRPRPAAPNRIVAAFLSALLLAGLLSIPASQTVLAGTPVAAACDGVRLRNGPSTTDAQAATINAGTQVMVENSVTGGAWNATCAGGTVSGDSWYQISEVNGQGVAALYSMPG